MGNALGDWIGEVTAAKGWSGSELARRSDVSKATVSRAISGKTFPERETIEKICEALGRDVGEAYAALVGDQYILVRRDLLTHETQSQVRRLLLNRRAGREIKELMRAILDQMEERKE